MQHSPCLKSRNGDSTARNFRASAAMANHNGVDFVAQLFLLPPMPNNLYMFTRLSIDAKKEHD